MRKVFDNYAVTVMIGDDPYTLGLFDTAGAPTFSSALQSAPSEPASLFPSTRLFATCRPRGLRPSPTIIIPPDGRFPRVFQRDVAPVVREREGEVVP